jgi:hypothetical protein
LTWLHGLPGRRMADIIALTRAIGALFLTWELKPTLNEVISADTITCRRHLSCHRPVPAPSQAKKDLATDDANRRVDHAR